MRQIVANAEPIVPGVEHINRTGGVVAGALPLLYGMAEGIVAGVTPQPETPGGAPAGQAGRPVGAARGCTTAWATGRLPSRLPLVAGLSVNRAGIVRLRPVVSGPVVGAVYSPIQWSCQDRSYCCSLQLGW